MTAARRRAEKTGRGAERYAAMVLRLKGFSILARRYKTRRGEIDLIARRGRLLVFAEVKARKNLDAATEAVSAAASRRIEAAADLYLARHPHLVDLDMRYDIFAIAGWRLRQLSAAWRANG